jgi:hypothetical protein
MLNKIQLECYAIYSGDPEIKEAVGYCVVGEGELFVGDTQLEAEELALDIFPDAEILDSCGWILPHETEELRKSKVKLSSWF